MPRADLLLRKTPRQRRATLTVDVLLEAAAQVLEADGLAGFNTNAVARRAGVSVGSLYQYFPSKQALTLALLRREDALFHQEAGAGLALPTCREAIGHLIAVAARQQLTRPQMARLLDEEEGRPEFRAALADGPDFQALIDAMLDLPGAPSGLRREYAAADLLAMMRGMTDSAGGRGERDVADLSRRIGAAMFGYLDAF